MLKIGYRSLFFGIHPSKTMTLRGLELFAGIGGFAAASRGLVDVVQAIDVSELSRQAYQSNQQSSFSIRNIESLTAADLAIFDAEFWWLSPPCQPFTRRGKQRDLDDPRCAALINILDLIAELQPTYIGLENVPPFAESRAAMRLREVLQRCGYFWSEQVVCPTELGIANRRRRFYLFAGKFAEQFTSDAQKFSKISGDHPRSIADIVIRANSGDPSLIIPERWQSEYEYAIDVLDATDPYAIGACFTSAYGRSPVRSGSYLRDANGIRFFSPEEIVRLLGFGDDFKFPPQLTRGQCWGLAGNSINVDVVRAILRQHLSPFCMPS